MPVAPSVRFEPIHPQTTVGAAHLTVADLERALGFYVDALGWRVVRRDGGAAALSTSGRPADQLLLTEQAGARPQPSRAGGLYHLALLHPTRRALARTLHRLFRLGVPIHGASDHLVSEAIYLADPDGHGIELYADRPREAWPRRDGALAMDTVPLDLDDLMGQLDPDETAWTGTDPATRLGHIHLRTGHLGEAAAFYRDLLGFEEVLWYGERALFLAAGGYHHHIGLNTWAGVGVPPAPADSARLVSCTVAVPSIAELARLAARVETYAHDRVIARDPTDGSLHVRGPDGVEVILAVLPRGETQGT